MYIYRNIKARLYKHCAVGKQCVTYFECAFVAVDAQHATRMCHIVICSLYGCTIFFHIVSYTPQISKKKLLNTKYVFRLSLQIYLKHFSFYVELSEI
jgi:hypothetical protein